MIDTDEMIRKYTDSELQFEKLKELFGHPAIATVLDRLEKTHVNQVIEAESPAKRDESRVFVKVLRTIRQELSAQAMLASNAKQEVANIKNSRGK